MNTPNNEKKPPIPAEIVIPDECGDSLWDKVLAQQPDLATLTSKPADTAADLPPTDPNVAPTKS